MELLYLLGSIIWNSAVSLTLSLLLPFCLLIRRLLPPPATTFDAGITLYEGVVWHERRRPVHHKFQYNVRYALIELDRCSQFTSSNRYSADEARKITQTNGPVSLLTIPPSVGYEQNPLSLYYCYDVEDFTSILKKCIAEVTNTPWGERVSFVFNPSSDMVAKALHVSPFMYALLANLSSVIYLALGWHVAILRILSVINIAIFTIKKIFCSCASLIALGCTECFDFRGTCAYDDNSLNRHGRELENKGIDAWQ